MAVEHIDIQIDSHDDQIVIERNQNKSPSYSSSFEAEAEEYSIIQDKKGATATNVVKN